MSDQHILPSHNNNQQPIKVLLVIDNLTFSTGLKMLLGSDLALNVEETGRANGAKSASINDPDVVVMVVEHFADLHLISELHRASSASRILSFICPDDDYLKRNVMQYGAAGIVTAEDDPAMLFAAIKALYAHKTFISPLVSHTLFSHRRDLERESLTPREYEVVQCVCQGFVNKEIAVKLHMSEPTVKHHMRTIFEKLYVSNRAALVAYAFTNGIVQPHSLAISNQVDV